MSTTDDHRVATPASPSSTAVPPTTPPATTPPVGPRPVRASNAEREAIVSRLHQALGEGRLDLDEVEIRIAAAYAARHRDELPPLLADLPSTATPTAGASGAPSWTALASGLVWRLRILLLGPDGTAEPTPAQRRRAGLIAVLVVAWLVVCALLGAVLA